MPNFKNFDNSTDTDAHEDEDFSLEGLDQGFGEAEEDLASSGAEDNRTSPAIAKIVALKRQMKAIQEENRRLKAAAPNPEKEAIRESYLAKGFDEDAAEAHAATAVELKALREASQLQNFRDQNLSVLMKYPKAMENLKWIADAQKVTGLTVEQLCQMKFGNDPATRDLRNKQAATGTHGTSDTTVTDAMLTSESSSDLALSQKDQKTRSYFEGLLGPMSNEEWIELKKRRNL